MPVRRVAEGEDGERLDVLVARWLGEPRARAQQRLVRGEVVVDDRPAAKAHRARAGERVEVRAPAPATPPAVPVPAVPVRYEDDDLAIVAKPAGLVVHAGAGAVGPTLVDALRAAGLPLAAGDDPARPGIVHRLDRGTSGLLVVAKTERAREALQAMLARRDVERRYCTIVDGVPSPPRATVDAPLGRHPVHRQRFAVVDGGRRAVTHYDVTEDHGRAAVLRVRLETGRTHQIRVHLAAVGHPVAGDRTYGASPALAAALGLRRPALHAAALRLRHPVTGADVAVDEPLPEDLAAALDRLRTG